MNKKKFKGTAWMRYGLSMLLPAMMLVFSSAKMEIDGKGIICENIAEPMTVFQQIKRSKPIADTLIYSHLLPQFPGGDIAFGKYLESAIQYPAEARKNNIQGRVIVYFIVEKDGSLTNIKVLRDIGSGCGKEAIRVLKKSPKWRPAIYDQKPVRADYTCPISFNLPNQQKLAIDNPPTNKTLYLLNEKEISAEELNKLDPTTFRFVEALKDSTAVALYGTKGKNGVIKITTY
ncbi:MAG: TonB family protein [Sphingobacteriaceae bacterium]